MAMCDIFGQSVSLCSLRISNCAKTGRLCPPVPLKRYEGTQERYGTGKKLRDDEKTRVRTDKTTTNNQKCQIPFFKATHPLLYSIKNDGREAHATFLCPAGKLAEIGTEGSGVFCIHGCTWRDEGLWRFRPRLMNGCTSRLRKRKTRGARNG